MSLTRTQREVYHYFAKSDFVSPAVIEGFRQRLEQEDNLQTLDVALDDFRNERCPNCEIEGAFKYHFLGKLKHPDCGWSWHIGPGSYAVEQLGRVFRAGMEVGAEAMGDAERKGEKGGCLGAIFGFIFGVAFRLPFALLMIPIQAIISLSQQKPQSGLQPSATPSPDEATKQTGSIPANAEAALVAPESPAPHAPRNDGELYPIEDTGRYRYCLADLPYVENTAITKSYAWLNEDPDFKRKHEVVLEELKRHEAAILAKKFWSPAQVFSYSLLSAGQEEDGKYFFRFLAHDVAAPDFDTNTDDASIDGSVLILCFEFLPEAANGEIHNSWAYVSDDYQERMRESGSKTSGEQTKPFSPADTGQSKAHNPRPAYLIVAAVLCLVIIVSFVLFKRSRNETASGFNSIGYVNTENLNLRAGPGANQVAITRLSQGTKVFITNETQDIGGTIWVKVRIGNQEGWVNLKYLGRQ